MTDKFLNIMDGSNEPSLIERYYDEEGDEVEQDTIII